MLNNLPIICRFPIDEDLPFIYSSWIRSFGNMHINEALDRNWYALAQHLVIGWIFKDAEIIVACNPEDSRQIVGYIVYKDRTLHYVYVKNVFRGKHAGTNLMKEAFQNFSEPIFVSHWTPVLRFFTTKWNLKNGSRALQLRAGE